MDIEIVLPDESPDMAPRTLVELAVLAERLGYRRAWLPDHLLPPGEYGKVYGGVYEPLVTLAHLAARTSTIGLGTSVMVLPLREPVLVAKQAATLDLLSGGRLTLGVGVGWNEAEFGDIGADFRTRGARTDEAIGLLHHLWRGDGPSSGRFHSIGPGVFAPRPGRAIPIMVGGTSDRALRRAAELADEWQGIGADGFAAASARLRELTDRPIRVGTRIECTDDAELDRAAATVRELTAAGADAVAVWFGEADTAARRVERLADAIR